MKLEAGKRYRTRDGREVTISAVNENPYTRKYHYAVGWLGEKSKSWSRDGFICGDENPLDLIAEVKPKQAREYWLNLYNEPNRVIAGYHEQEMAHNFAAPDRIACVKVRVEFEEG